MIDALDAHKRLWDEIQPVLLTNRLPHAFLFIGPRHAHRLEFAMRLIALLLCEGSHKPCGTCSACLFIMNANHPDIHRIGPEAPATVIKIDQIRRLQLDVYQTPIRGNRRFVIIEPLDKMNTAAANALLKLLEEPPSHTLFILLAEQTYGLPATILSRCQRSVFPIMDTVDTLLSETSHPHDSPRATLLKKMIPLVTALLHMLQGKIAVCTVAADCSGYEIEDILWFFDILIARLIYMHLTPECLEPLPLFDELMPYTFLPCLFSQRDSLQAFMQKMNHTTSMNQTLLVETLLLGFIQEGIACKSPH